MPCPPITLTVWHFTLTSPSLRAHALPHLTLPVTERRHEAAVTIQHSYGAHAGRRGACATRLQAAVRGRRQLKLYNRMRVEQCAATRMQAAARGRQPARALVRARHACVQLQRACRRAFGARREAAAQTIQRATRMRHFRRVMCLVRIQRAFRAHLCRRLLKGLREVSRLRALAG